MTSVFSILFVGIIGCGGSSETSAPATSELQDYVTQNADLIAQQEAIEAARNAAKDAEDAE